jgi:hypothetical protein
MSANEAIGLSVGEAAHLQGFKAGIFSVIMRKLPNVETVSPK